MRDYVHEHFKRYADQRVKPVIVCKDGTEYSVQASSRHYCSPKEDFAPEYRSVEVMSDRRHEPEGWVPVAVINRRIHRHGGAL